MKKINQPLPHYYTRYITALIILLPFSPFLSTLGGTMIGPLWLWKSAIDITLYIMLAVALIILIYRGYLRQLVADKWMRIFFIYMTIIGVYSLVSLSLTHLSNTALAAGIIMDSRYVAMFLLTYIICRYSIISKKDVTGLLPTIAIIGLVLAVIGIIQVTLLPKMFLANFGYNSLVTIAPFLTVSDNQHVLRAFATLRGPNDYGAYLILGLLATVVVKPRYWRWLVNIIGIGIILSYSRSALFGLLIALVSFVFVGRKFGPFLRTHISAFTVGVLAIGMLVVSALFIPSVRLVVFHSDADDSSITKGSTDNHLSSTLSGLERVIAQPLGCGVGCAGPASYYGNQPHISENYYVQIAEEFGIVGLLLWLGLFTYVLRELYDRHTSDLAKILLTSGIGFAVIGLMLHVWSDGPLSLTWWGLVGIAIGTARVSNKDMPARLKM